MLQSSPPTVRVARSRRPSGRLVGAGLIVLALTILIISAATGPLPVPLADAGRLVLGHLIPGMPWMSDGSLTNAQDQAVWSFRLPRAMLAGLAGANLALAGTLLQAAVRNPLAEPYVIGVSSGAGLGAVGLIALGGAATSGGLISLAASIGAGVATIAVSILGHRRGVLSPARLVLAGVALSALFGSLTNALVLTTEAQDVYSVMFFLLGSVAAATWEQTLFPLIALIIVGVPALLTGRGLDALLVGDEGATAVGMDVRTTRRLLLIGAAVLTGTTVCVTGSIGFVGLVVPHLIRLTLGAGHRRLVPISMAAGAVFLMLCDLLARTIASPVEVPLGVVTAALGAPFFLWLMRRGTAAEALDR